MKSKVKDRMMGLLPVKINAEIRDLPHDPNLTAKKERAISFLKKNPIPKDMAKKSGQNVF